MPPTSIYGCNLRLEDLFDKYNKEYFGNKLKDVEVKWSNRLTSTVGTCTYSHKKEATLIYLSLPLLSLRPRKDLAETLLHEMIHAIIGESESEEHGPKFEKWMDKINKRGYYKITKDHDFNDEVEELQKHWWKCTGKCTKLEPKFGIVKRSMNRPPGPSEQWFLEHKKHCKGKFVKVKEPKN